MDTFQVHMGVQPSNIEVSALQINESKDQSEKIIQ